MKKILLSLSVVLLVGSFSGLATAKNPDKEDTCKVIVYADGDYKRSQAQYAKIPRTDGISQDCLAFANLGSTIGAACGGGQGEVQIYQIRRVMPKTIDLAEHCHYKCLGEPESECERNCQRKPAQIATNIGTIPCPQ